MGEFLVQRCVSIIKLQRRKAPFGEELRDNRLPQIYRTGDASEAGSGALCREGKKGDIYNITWGRVYKWKYICVKKRELSKRKTLAKQLKFLLSFTHCNLCALSLHHMCIRSWVCTRGEGSRRSTPACAHPPIPPQKSRRARPSPGSMDACAQAAHLVELSRANHEVLQQFAASKFQRT